MISFADYRARVHETKTERMKRDVLYRFIRAISVRFSYALVKFLPAILPNQVSVGLILVLLVLIISNVFYGVGLIPWLVVVQLLVLQLVAIGDRVDGEIARFKNHFTQSGIYYDRIFHFIYPFSLYLSVGSFFSATSEWGWLILAASVLAALASLANLLGKLRHHIKYKIRLEKHEKIILDFHSQTPPKHQSSLVGRLGHYFVFMMYDWVWLLYLALVGVNGVAPIAARGLYLAHTLISLLVLLHYILIVYPRRHLFSGADFGGA